MVSVDYDYFPGTDTLNELDIFEFMATQLSTSEWRKEAMALSGENAALYEDVYAIVKEKSYVKVQTRDLRTH